MEALINNSYTPNTAAIPNILFDYWMAKLSPGEWKVLSAIARKTYGWQKARDRISLRQLVELTGLHKNGVIKATEHLVSLGLVIKIKSKDAFDGSDAPNQYEINVDCEDAGEQNNDRGSTPSGQGVVHPVDTPPVHTVDTQNPLLTKPTIQKREREDKPPLPPPPSKKKKDKKEMIVPFGEHVLLREGEYETLCGEIGKTLVDYYILAVNNHVPNSKPYKDYAAVIRQWHLRDKANGKMPNIQKIQEINPSGASSDSCAKNKYLAELAEQKLSHLYNGRVYFQAMSNQGLIVHLDKDIKKEINYASYDAAKFKEVLIRELEACFPNARNILMGCADNKVVNILSNLSSKFKTTEAGNGPMR